jgi:DNA-binding protein H-NS
MPRRTRKKSVDERENNPVEPHEEALSSGEGIPLIEGLLNSLTAQELLTIRDLAEQKRKDKLKAAKTAFLKETKRQLSELGLTLNDVFPAKRGHKRSLSSPIKYRSPSGETWTGRGVTPKWLRELVAQGHSREEYKVAAPIGSHLGK